MDEEQLEDMKELGNAAQVRSDAKFREAAILFLSGHDYKTIAKAVGFKPDYVYKIVLRHPKFIQILKDISDRELARSIIDARQKITKLTGLAYEALEYQLKEKKSLEGVRIVFEQLSSKEKMEKPAEPGQAGITVVFPTVDPNKKPDIIVKPSDSGGET